MNFINRASQAYLGKMGVFGALPLPSQFENAQVWQTIRVLISGRQCRFFQRARGEVAVLSAIDGLCNARSRWRALAALGVIHI